MEIEKIIKEISKKTGISQNDVRSTVFQWATPLMEKGIIVKLEVKRWRGTKSISPEELGIDESDSSWEDFKDYLSLGSRSLLPKKVNSKINVVENRARSLLKSFSFETMWGRFVPCTMFAEWQDKDKDVQKSYYELADSLKDQFDEIKKEVILHYRKYCKKIWEDGVVTSNWKNYLDYEKYFISKIEEEIIDPNSFRESFKYNTIFYCIPMPSDIEKDVCEAKKIENEKEISDHEKEMKKRLVENLNSFRQEHVENFLESTVGQIRKSILTIVKDVRKSLSNDPDQCLSRGANRKKLLNMIDNISSLNFYNDDQVQKILNTLKEDLTKNKSVRSDREIDETLKDIECIVSLEYSDLIYGRFNQLEF